MSRLCVAALACAAALVAGCGGDGDGESGGKLSNAEFVKEADKVCMDTNKRAGEVEEPMRPSDIDRFVDQTTPIIDEQRKKLRALEGRAPADVSADFSRMVDVLDRQIDKFGEFKDAGGDRAKITATGEELGRLGVRFQTLAGRVGLKDCRG